MSVIKSPPERTNRTTRYELTREILGNAPIHTLAKSEFEKIKSAKELLTVAIVVEENYAAILDNLVELESTVAEIMINDMVYGFMDYESFRGCFRKVDRRLLNFLGACRAYLDKTDHELKHRYGENSIERTKFKQVTHEFHAQKFAYRIMDGLRNFLHHQGDAVHSATFGHRWLDHDLATQRAEYSFDFFLDPSQLAASNKLNAKTRKEVSEKPEKLDLKQFYREYVASLSHIHRRFRELLMSETESAESLIVETIDILVVLDGSKPSQGDFAQALHMRGSDVAERVDLFRAFPKYWRTLQSRHRPLSNYEKRFYTGATSSHRKKN